MKADNSADNCFGFKISKYKKKKNQIGRMDDTDLTLSTGVKALTLFSNADMTSQRQNLSVLACHIKRQLVVNQLLEEKGKNIAKKFHVSFLTQGKPLQILMRLPFFPVRY